METDDHPAAYLPTAAEIEQACQRIQATWRPCDELRRRVSMPRARVPVVDLAELDAAEGEGVE